MSEPEIQEVPAGQNEPATAPVTASGVGGMLAAAREAAALSIDDVAAKLRRSPKQIRALEAEDFGNLPDPTSVRGFIRNYAKLLGMDAEPLIQVYGARLPEQDSQSISLHSENIRIAGGDAKAWQPYLLAALLVGLSLGGWLAFMEYQAQQPVAPVAAVPQATEQATEEAVPAPTLPEEVAQPAPVDAAAATVTGEQTTPAAQPAAPPVMESPAPVAAEPAAGVTATPATPTASAPAPSVSGARLEMRFSQEVWISVLDRDGKEVFNKTKPAGSQDLLEGTPPYQITIGNASGVSLTYNGKPVDLAPHTKANVARLTLE